MGKRETGTLREEDAMIGLIEMANLLMKETLIPDADPGSFLNLNHQVFPISLGIKDGKKTWLTGIRWKDELHTLETFKKHLEHIWNSHQPFNAIAAKTDLFVVVDCDSKLSANGEPVGVTIVREFIADENAVFTNTQSGGRHYYFKGNCQPSAMFGIDVLSGPKKSVILPPSTVQGGGRYQWGNCNWFKKPLTRIPRGLIGMLQPVQKRNGGHMEGQCVKTPEELSPKQRYVFNRLLNEVEQAMPGSRSDCDFSLLSWAVKCNMAPEPVWEAVRDYSKFKIRGKPYFDLTWGSACERTVA